MTQLRGGIIEAQGETLVQADLSTVQGVVDLINQEIKSDFTAKSNLNGSKPQRARSEAFRKIKTSSGVDRGYRDVRGRGKRPEVGELSPEEEAHTPYQLTVETIPANQTHGGKIVKWHFALDAEVDARVQAKDEKAIAMVHRGSMREFDDTFWWSHKVNEIMSKFRSMELDFSLETMSKRWETRRGVVSAHRKDLPYFVALYEMVSRCDTGADHEVMIFLENYYARTSLKIRQRDDLQSGVVRYAKADEDNWRVACALAIAGGMPQEKAFVYYRIPADGKARTPRSDVIRTVETLVQGRSSENDVSPLYAENARIIGRITMLNYIYTRLQLLKDNIGVYPDQYSLLKRVLAEVVIMSVLGLVPEDEETKALMVAEEEVLQGTIKSAFGPVEAGAY